ncbi:ATPase, T2SS/T4P/T4SS family [Pseudosulfitobacter pseudonitzschiae]|uniref:ATPase, T2SS/T4P/T4SS family n=1 Tax=Pseudosulfitobacter pseudonitzschiae TaxID=1402135 RepID=UPI0024DF305F|nr:ATPase, T2SS/T4P/T4SS family [Pseudosulfitobacter pseudonitzschiae]
MGYVVDDMMGFGPLERLLADDDVSDILVNGPQKVYVERGGKLELTDVSFRDDQHVMNIASRIVSAAGRRVDESTPLVDTRLADGSRINVTIPPLAVDGPTITIRKFPKEDLTLADLASRNTLSPQMAELLRIAAYLRLNILFSGGTGAARRRC